ncbi:hypothetical protein BX070DRAFT_189111 [Coemansia spiralis]|nr:hypothetical protein BX070DRAFT_189111 [Coemansia spiralis]
MPPLLREIVTGLTSYKELPGDAATHKIRSLPTVILYDDNGLDLFDRITYLPEYYLTACEIEVLESKIQEIVAEIPSNSDVIELGCGSLRKTKLLLDALNKHQTGVTYYAIDVMPQPLHESMKQLARRLSNISFVALCGTYDEVLVHFKQSTRRKTVLWLGSSIGNLSAKSAIDMLSGIATNALAVNDAVIVGMDKQKDPAIIIDAYHDPQGMTARFELNALAHANNINSGTQSMFDLDKFKYVGGYDANIGRHSAYLEAKMDATLCGDSDDMVFKRGDRIYIESSHKYGEGAAETIARASRLMHIAEWSDSRNYYSLNLFRKPLFSMTPSLAIDTIPNAKEWRELWSVWDALTLHIIPHSKLLDRPIDLRHPFIFYLGHIPAFADIHMTAADLAPLTEPSVYAQWFERGIDPNIEDSTICHSHSEIPKDWPPLDEVLAYRDRVRKRILAWLGSYAEYPEQAAADAARHIWMSFEHEAMHIETLLYMVLQMPPSTINPPISIHFALQNAQRPKEQWIKYAGGRRIPFGLSDDNEHLLQSQKLPPRHVFGWDNESPQTKIDMKPFIIRTQPVTNGEYMDFLHAIVASSSKMPTVEIGELIPLSWVKLDSDPASVIESASHTGNYTTELLEYEYGVRTVVGTPSISSTEASLWPVFVSQKQAHAYAHWRGKRLPSEQEWTHSARTYHLARALSSLYLASSKSHLLGTSTLAEDSTQQPIDSYLEKMLAEQGTTAEEQVMQHPFDMYIPSDANVGFAHWHPMPVSTKDPNTRNTNEAFPEATFIGNGWEWTATQFYPYEGFKASPMYPGYSADFFDPQDIANTDSVHYVVKGGSYVTHLRIAQRQTFRNWYQRGYPYVLATFRLCDQDE